MTILEFDMEHDRESDPEQERNGGDFGRGGSDWWCVEEFSYFDSSN